MIFLPWINLSSQNSYNLALEVPFFLPEQLSILKCARSPRACITNLKSMFCLPVSSQHQKCIVVRKFSNWHKKTSCDWDHQTFGSIYIRFNHIDVSYKFFFFATWFTGFATFFKFSPHSPIFSPHTPYIFWGGLCRAGRGGLDLSRTACVGSQ
jgi:hypothetical protein